MLTDPSKPKVLARPRTKLIVLAVCAGALTVGVLFAPDRVREQPRPPEDAVPILSELVQGREAARMFRAMRATARTVVPSTVSFWPSSPEPEAPSTESDLQFMEEPAAPQGPTGYGVIVSPDGDVLTTARAVEWQPQVQAALADGRRVAADLRLFDPISGLAMARLQTNGPMASISLPLVPATPGELVFATAPHGDEPLVAPVFLIAREANRYRVSAVPLGMVGAPLFNLDGQVIGITMGSEPVSQAYRIDAALDRLQELEAQDRGWPAVVGIALQDLDDRLTGVVGAGGVLIADVRPDSPAQAARLQPGDVVTAIGGTAVADAPAARRAITRLPPDTPVEFSVRRAGRDLEVSLTPQALFNAPWSRAERPPPTGPRADSLFAEDALVAAGVPPDAHVLEPDRRLAALRRARGPQLVRFAHDGRRFLAVVEGPR